MQSNYGESAAAKTTARRRIAILAALLLFGLFSACGQGSAPEEEHGGEEAIARTEFTDRIENFFEFDPLHAGKESQFLIHLTDLSDGTPVENAKVTLEVKDKSGGKIGEIESKVGRVTGIYVATVKIDQKGSYDITFTVRNEKLNETMALKDFEVQ